jgi:hypothetical protein
MKYYIKTVETRKFLYFLTFYYKYFFKCSINYSKEDINKELRSDSKCEY